MGVRVREAGGEVQSQRQMLAVQVRWALTVPVGSEKEEPYVAKGRQLQDHPDVHGQWHRMTLEEGERRKRWTPGNHSAVRTGAPDWTATPTDSSYFSQLSRHPRPGRVSWGGSCRGRKGLMPRVTLGWT